MKRFLFFVHKDKWWVGPLGILAFIVFYMIPNHIHLFQPQALSMTYIDTHAPVMPWTIFVYTSDYLFIFLAFVMLKNKDNMNKVFVAQMLTLVASAIIFILYPTTYPRVDMDFTQASWASAMMLKLVHSLDSPANCFPSLHVSMTFLGSFGFLKEQKSKFPIFFLWAVAISLSTLTTKQHYLADILGGFGMALLMYVLVNKFVKIKN